MNQESLTWTKRFTGLAPSYNPVKPENSDSDKNKNKNHIYLLFY